MSQNHCLQIQDKNTIAQIYKVIASQEEELSSSWGAVDKVRKK
jgi:hypothetical protein